MLIKAKICPAIKMSASATLTENESAGKRMYRRGAVKGPAPNIQNRHDLLVSVKANGDLR